MLKRFTMLTFLMPRSMPETYVQCKSAFSASCSCVSPSASLRLRIAAPSGFRGSVTDVTTYRWFYAWSREYIAYSLCSTITNTRDVAARRPGRPEGTTNGANVQQVQRNWKVPAVQGNGTFGISRLWPGQEFSRQMCVLQQFRCVQSLSRLRTEVVLAQWLAVKEKHSWQSS